MNLKHLHVCPAAVRRPAPRAQMREDREGRGGSAAVPRRPRAPRPAAAARRPLARATRSPAPASPALRRSAAAPRLAGDGATVAGSDASSRARLRLRRWRECGGGRDLGGAPSSVPSAARGGRGRVRGVGCQKRDSMDGSFRGGGGGSEAEGLGHQQISLALATRVGPSAGCTVEILVLLVCHSDFRPDSRRDCRTPLLSGPTGARSCCVSALHRIGRAVSASCSIASATAGLPSSLL